MAQAEPGWEAKQEKHTVVKTFKRNWCKHHFSNTGWCRKAADCTYMHTAEDYMKPVTDLESMGFKVEYCRYFWYLDGRHSGCLKGDNCLWAHEFVDKWKAASAKKKKGLAPVPERGRSSDDSHARSSTARGQAQCQGHMPRGDWHQSLRREEAATILGPEQHMDKHMPKEVTQHMDKNKDEKKEALAEAGVPALGQPMASSVHPFDIDSWAKKGNDAELESVLELIAELSDQDPKKLAEEVRSMSGAVRKRTCDHPEISLLEAWEAEADGRFKGRSEATEGTLYTVRAIHRGTGSLESRFHKGRQLAKAEEKEEAEEAADPAEAGAAPEVAALEEDAAPEAHPTVPPLIEAPGEAAERTKDKKMNPAFTLVPKALEEADAAHEACSVYASNFGFAKLFDTTVEEEAEQQPSSLTQKFLSLF